MDKSNAASAFIELIGPERAKIILDRVRDRLQRAQSPPSVTLPVSKPEFPKMLCLDMMHWVGLARAHYKTMNPTHAAFAALDAIRSATKKGRLVVPVLAPNLHEASEHPDEERRTRLALFMVNLSRNFATLNPRVLEDREIAHAVEKHLLGTSTRPPLRPGLIHWGFAAAAIDHEGTPKAYNSFETVLVQQLSKEPEISVVLLIAAMDQEAVKAMRAREEASLPFMEEARKTDTHLSRIQRWSWAMYHCLKNGKGRHAEEISANLLAQGISPLAFRDLLETSASRLRFIGDLPQLYIRTMLEYERNRSGNDRYQANDYKDGMFLGQAIAYANIVLTENRWSQHARTTGIAKECGTIVLASLKDLPDALEKEGCLQ